MFTFAAGNNIKDENSVFPLIGARMAYFFSDLSDPALIGDWGLPAC